MVGRSGWGIGCPRIRSGSSRPVLPTRSGSSLLIGCLLCGAIYSIRECQHNAKRPNRSLQALSCTRGVDSLAEERKQLGNLLLLRPPAVFADLECLGKLDLVRLVLAVPVGKLAAILPGEGLIA